MNPMVVLALAMVAACCIYLAVAWAQRHRKTAAANKLAHDIHTRQGWTPHGCPLCPPCPKCEAKSEH